MTYKYIYIRRAVYEKNPAGKLNAYRSLSDMVRLFKLPYWIMLSLLLFAIIFLAIIIIFNPKSLFLWISMAIIILISILSQIQREKHLYNEAVREQEVSEIKENYEEYVLCVLNIFENYGIDTAEKLQKLKNECEVTLKKHEDKLAIVNSKIFDMLIGVPLGALIASLIYSNGNVIPVAVTALILIGLSALVLLRLVGFLVYYSAGYFKDKYLLDAIIELDYSEKFIQGQNY